MDEERHADPDGHAYGYTDCDTDGNTDGNTHGHAYGNPDGQDGRRRRADALAGGAGPVRRRADDAAQKKRTISNGNAV